MENSDAYRQNSPRSGNIRPRVAPSGLTLAAPIPIYQRADSLIFSVKDANPGPRQLNTHRKDYSMALPLMPKATAVWLVDNTTLNFRPRLPNSPACTNLRSRRSRTKKWLSASSALILLTNGQLSTGEIEIKRAEEKPAYRLKLSSSDIPRPKARSKGRTLYPCLKTTRTT